MVNHRDHIKKLISFSASLLVFLSIYFTHHQILVILKWFGFLLRPPLSLNEIIIQSFKTFYHWYNMCAKLSKQSWKHNRISQWFCFKALFTITKQGSMCLIIQTNRPNTFPRTHTHTNYSLQQYNILYTPLQCLSLRNHDIYIINLNDTSKIMFYSLCKMSGRFWLILSLWVLRLLILGYPLALRTLHAIKSLGTPVL